MALITKSKCVYCKPYDNQIPGTSGIRKKTRVFMQPNYLELYVQSIFNALKSYNRSVEGSTMLIGGDGRYFTEEAIQVIARIAAGNGVCRVWIGVNGLVSTPAGSAIIRERENGICLGGFLLTASHNPGGFHEDFGVKYNDSNGGPANEFLTKLISENTKIINSYCTCDLPNINIHRIGEYHFLDGEFTVEVIDAAEDWLKIMRNTFDFNLIRDFCHRDDFSMLFDAMHGVAGPYARRVFIDELNCNESCLMRCDNLPDFGKCHPDPNLTYAKELVNRMAVNCPLEATSSTPVFGAAWDGDGDRNMILGAGMFVTPSDSVAIIAAKAEECIPYFRSGVTGVSRSMPTSGALDNVSKTLNVPLYEVPTGWKFFGNLMDARLISICGEESFGTGSDHIREKDGIWAVLAWLSILANRNLSSDKLIGVRDIVEEFWGIFGRNYYLRYDYENVASENANALMDYLRSISPEIQKIQNIRSEIAQILGNSVITKADEFCYNDPIDGCVTTQQGLRFFLGDSGSRIVYRLSGTGSEGATIRVYMEKYERKNIDMDIRDALQQVSSLAVSLAQIEKFTGRSAPNVIT